VASKFREKSKNLKHENVFGNEGGRKLLLLLLLGSILAHHPPFFYLRARVLSSKDNGAFAPTSRLFLNVFINKK
jgi:hypothetical protein